MSRMFRLTKEEDRALREKSIEINKVLIGEGIQPLKDSELLHLVLKDAIKRIKVNKEGVVDLP